MVLKKLTDKLRISDECISNITSSLSSSSSAIAQKNGKKEREKEIIKLTSRVLLSLDDDGKKGDRKYVIKFN